MIVIHHSLYHAMSQINKCAPFGTIWLFEHGRGGKLVRFVRDRVVGNKSALNTQKS